MPMNDTSVSGEAPAGRAQGERGADEQPDVVGDALVRVVVRRTFQLQPVISLAVDPGTSSCWSSTGASGSAGSD